MTQFRALEKIAEKKIRQKQIRGLMVKIEKYDLTTIGLESNVDMMESDLHELMHVYYKRHGVILYSKVFFSWHAVRWCCMIFFFPHRKQGISHETLRSSIRNAQRSLMLNVGNCRLCAPIRRYFTRLKVF